LAGSADWLENRLSVMVTNLTRHCQLCGIRDVDRQEPNASRGGS